jgi:hypothetical protein
VCPGNRRDLNGHRTAELGGKLASHGSRIFGEEVGGARGPGGDGVEVAEHAARPAIVGRCGSSWPGRRRWGGGAARGLAVAGDVRRSSAAQVGAGQGMVGGGGRDVGEKVALGDGGEGRLGMGDGRRLWCLVAGGTTGRAVRGDKKVRGG